MRKIGYHIEERALLPTCEHNENNISFKLKTRKGEDVVQSLRIHHVLRCTYIHDAWFQTRINFDSLKNQRTECYLYSTRFLPLLQLQWKLRWNPWEAATSHCGGLHLWIQDMKAYCSGCSKTTEVLWWAGKSKTASDVVLAWYWSPLKETEILIVSTIMVE